MRMTHIIEDDVNCAFVKFVGAIGAANIRAALMYLSQHPNRRSGMNRLIDYRHAELRLAPAGVRSIADMMSLLEASVAKVKVAMLVADETSRESALRLAELSEELRTPMRVFRDERAAIEWLGLPKDYRLPFDERP